MAERISKFNQKVDDLFGDSIDFLSKGVGFFTFNDRTWFKPIHSCKEGFCKGIGIVTAMPVYCLIVLESLVLSAFMCAKALADLAAKDTEVAGESAQMSCMILVFAAIFAVFALFSPIANFIDFVGSLVSTASVGHEKPAVEEDPAPEFNP